MRKEDDSVKIHLSEISSIILQTEQVYLSAYLMAELAKQKISLVISDEKCNPVGQYLPLYGSHNSTKRIATQLEWGEPIKKRVWQRIVKDKIYQQARLLERQECNSDSKVLLSFLPEVRSGDVTNREAQAARLYFLSLFGPTFTRDLDCPENASLNYGYSILLSLVNREIVARGYLTQRGICHRSEFNQFNLSCDFMEPFRPVVDQLVLDYLAEDFNADMRKVLSDISNKEVLYKGGVYRFSSVVSLYIQDCLNALNKKISIEDIESFEVL